MKRAALLLLLAAAPAVAVDGDGHSLIPTLLNMQQEIRTLRARVSEQQGEANELRRKLDAITNRSVCA